MMAAEKCVLQSSYTPLALPSDYTVLSTRIKYSRDPGPDSQTILGQTYDTSRDRDYQSSPLPHCHKWSLSLTYSKDTSAHPSLSHSAAYYLTVKAKFHYARWFEAGSKLVADRFEAGRRPASNQLA